MAVRRTLSLPKQIQFPMAATPSQTILVVAGVGAEAAVGVGVSRLWPVALSKLTES